jgi:hypothetical protein
VREVVEDRFDLEAEVRDLAARRDIYRAVCRYVRGRIGCCRKSSAPPSTPLIRANAGLHLAGRGEADFSTTRDWPA